MDDEVVKGLPFPYPSQGESLSFDREEKTVNLHGQGRLQGAG